MNSVDVLFIADVFGALLVGVVLGVMVSLTILRYELRHRHPKLRPSPVRRFPRRGL